MSDPFSAVAALGVAPVIAIAHAREAVERAAEIGGAAQ